jgi:hypothetical protein
MDGITGRGAMGRIAGALVAGFALLAAPQAGSAYERVHTLRWTQPDGGTPDGYAVSLGSRSGEYGESRDLGAVSAGGDGVRRADLVLEAFQDYYVVLTAYNAAGRSPYSNEVMVEHAACDATFCEDGNACTSDDCSGSGCIHQPLPDGTSCGTGLCRSGACQVVQCLENADCGDGNACNGVEVCAGDRCLAGSPPACGGETACTVSGCDAARGCVTRNKADGTSCSDGNASTVGDRCTGGVCVGTPQTAGGGGGGKPGGGSGGEPEPFCDAQCDDGNPCTREHCSHGACVYEPAPTGTTCDDGDPTTVADMCQAAVCEGTPGVGAPMCEGVSCEDGNTCTADACSEGSCSHVPLADGTRCDDGNRRTAGDRCVAGVCRPKDRSIVAHGKWRETRRNWDTRYWWGKPKGR